MGGFGREPGSQRTVRQYNPNQQPTFEFGYSFKKTAASALIPCRVLIVQTGRGPMTWIRSVISML